MTLERIKTGHYYVVSGGRRIGHVWRGCGGWAGSRHADGIEATGKTARQTAERVAEKDKER